MVQISGDVRPHSKLYRYLDERRLWQATHISSDPELEVKRLSGSHEVYRVDDERSRKKFILKSFRDPGVPSSKAHSRMEREYKRLEQADHVLSHTGWAHVVKPYCKSDTGDFFAEQYVNGETLSSYIRRAMEDGNSHSLYEKLTVLAGFFAVLHKNTRKQYYVRPFAIRDELMRHARQAYDAGAMTHGELGHMDHLIKESCTSHIIKNVKKALVHGDSTPTNFIYVDNVLYAIDLERAGYRDPAYDLGMMAGELCNYAIHYGHNAGKAEPFIGHFYWRYAGNFEDQRGKFDRLTKRTPIYMANSLLRISRHSYFSMDYKRQLTSHARECLEGLKKLNK
jgi:thiamine kinase-like enzyme